MAKMRKALPLFPLSMGETEVKAQRRKRKQLRAMPEEWSVEHKVAALNDEELHRMITHAEGVTSELRECKPITNHEALAAELQDAASQLRHLVSTKRNFHHAVAAAYRLGSLVVVANAELESALRVSVARKAKAGSAKGARKRKKIGEDSIERTLQGNPTVELRQQQRHRKAAK